LPGRQSDADSEECRASFRFVFQNARCRAYHRDGRRHHRADAFFAFLIVRATTPQMSPLFTDLSVEDSSAIIKDLERQGIPYDIKNDGAIILVPRDQIPPLRMKLAEGELPKGGGVGYAIFDKSDALGSTSFVQNINRLRALEGELARTIRALDRVQQARVHLVLPDRPLFSREKAEPSASIVLKVRGQLEPQQVHAIRRLVASAVAGLKPQRVSVVDETGRLLADGAGDDGGGGTADERKIAFEKRLREQVESIVTSVVGPSHAQVQLTADFDFNRIPRRRTATIRKAAWRGRARPARRSPPAATAAAIAASPWATNCPAQTPRRASSRASRTARARKSSTTRFPAPPRPR
jgi:flagellar M-ring protein FliF